MKVVIVANVVIALAVATSAAPVVEDDIDVSSNTIDVENKREKRSHYATPYISPCAAAAASAPIPAIAPYSIPAIQPSYSIPHQPSYGIPHYGYGLSHYRAEEPLADEHEMMSFSDMDHMMSEHMPMARTYSSLSAPHYGSVASGPAYGVFPNANVGGCNVPLLFSCAPTIVPGKIVKSHHYGYGGPVAVPVASPVVPEAYRGVDEHHHSESHDEHRDGPMTSQVMTPTQDSGHMTAQHQ